MKRQDFPTWLVYQRHWPFFGQLAYYALKLLGIEIPRSVPIGQGLELAHGAVGLVVHSKAKLGSNIKIYSGVTLGRADVHIPMSDSKFEGIIVEDCAILSPGSKILCKEGILRVGRGTIVGANAVLLSSTGENEIWAGVPARCVGLREQ